MNSQILKVLMVSKLYKLILEFSTHIKDIRLINIYKLFFSWFLLYIIWFILLSKYFVASANRLYFGLTVL